MFADLGFQGTTVRGIAERAGVDPALIHHYFGTKQQLFVAALRFPLDPAVVIPELLDAGPREEFARRLVSFFVAAWRDPASGERLRAVLRAAVSTDSGATLVQSLVEDVVLAEVGARLGLPRIRVVAALSHLLGLVLTATIIGVEPLASATDDELIELVTPAIASYLSPEFA